MSTILNFIVIYLSHSKTIMALVIIICSRFSSFCWKEKYPNKMFKRRSFCFVRMTILFNGDALVLLASEHQAPPQCMLPSSPPKGGEHGRSYCCEELAMTHAVTSRQSDRPSDRWGLVTLLSALYPKLRFTWLLKRLGCINLEKIFIDTHHQLRTVRLAVNTFLQENRHNHEPLIKICYWNMLYATLMQLLIIKKVFL